MNISSAITLIAIAGGFLFMTSCSQQVTGVVQPGYDWHDTDHLKDGSLTYNIRFHRSGFEPRDMGEFTQITSIAGDTMTLVRNTLRAGTEASDTLIMTYPELMPISFSSRQGSRKSHYKVVEGEVQGEVEYPNIEDFRFERPFDQPFFDLASIGLVLGGVNDESLAGKTIKIFDSESGDFTSFKVEKVERERIETAGGKTYNCNAFKGTINNAKATLWLDRRSGKLIKTYSEMQANMAVEMLLQ